jgi:Autophagy protein Atg8 ubiquitin like
MEFIDEFQKTEWQKRLAKSQRLRSAHPNRVPVIIDRSTTTSPIPRNYRFMIPIDFEESVNGEKVTRPMTLAHFMSVFRTHIPGLTPEKSVFMFVHGQNILPAMTDPISKIFEEYSEKCGFLYLTYGFENCFG